jgi:hypothetical protein
VRVGMTHVRNLVAAIILVVGFAAPVAAGPLDDANAAIKRHDYASALRILRPLADPRQRWRSGNSRDHVRKWAGRS